MRYDFGSYLVYLNSRVNLTLQRSQWQIWYPDYYRRGIVTIRFQRKKKFGTHDEYLLYFFQSVISIKLIKPYKVIKSQSHEKDFQMSSFLGIQMKKMKNSLILQNC